MRSRSSARIVSGAVSTRLRIWFRHSLLLYTDGVTEARNGTAFFGDDQLTGAMVSAPSSAEELVNGIFRAVMEYQAGTPRDDIAIVAVSVP